MSKYEYNPHKFMRSFGKGGSNMLSNTFMIHQKGRNWKRQMMNEKVKCSFKMKLHGNQCIRS